MLQVSVNIGDDGKTTVQESLVPMPDTPQTRRMKAMAEARPGCAVVGWKANTAPPIEDEKYLSEL